MSQFLVLSISSILICLVQNGLTQSNYANQANNVEFQGEGLPDQATLDGRVTKLDDLSPVIFLNRTKAVLNCAAGSMQVDLKFNEKFFGIAYADYDRNSACQVAGKGDISYKLELPLKGCGTKQEPQRVFTNNIVVRFHPNLEMDGDEIITIVCRYPPPVAPIPAGLPNFIKEDVAPAAVLEPPLKGFQILLIICGILFLSLLLLGLACSYYCLRKRHVTVIRHPFSSIGTGSEITKLSGSSLGNLSMFEGLKIPRAHAPVAAVPSSSGSEGPLISDTLPSDYPSESHSEIEDVDTRSLPVSSAGSFENKAFVKDTDSFCSEGYGHTQEQSVQNAVAATMLVPRLPVAIKESPKFDVQVRVKKQAPPPPPSLSLSSDTESSIARTERELSVIHEQREESVKSLESPHMVERMQFTYVPELHPPPRHIQPAPTYNKILRRQQELMEERSIASLNTELTDTHSVTEMMDDTHRRLVEAPIVPKDISSHLVDDVFLRTITEKKTIEDIERHKRLVTEYHARAKAMEDQKWDVTIKNYPIEQPGPPDWENFSDISSASGMTLTPKFERANMSLPPNTIDDNKLPLNAPHLVGSIGQHPARHTTSLNLPPTYLSTYELPIENPEVPNWNILLRVLQPTEQDEGPVIDSAETFNAQLTHADKIKWRQIITTESTLRTMLTEASVREDFERIRQDRRYEKLFEPPKWDVIIRILTPVDKPNGKNNRYKKKGDWDTRSRRSSLPTLYEYDSDGGSSARTLTGEPIHPNMPVRSRKTSRSSFKSDADVRSMSEMMVDFARPADHDSQSESSSYYPGIGRYFEDGEMIEYKLQHPSLARSLSQPSLARSASEFTERWVAPSRYDTASEFTSPEGTPKSQRSTRIQPHHVTRGGAQHAEHSSIWQTASSASSQIVGRPDMMAGDGGGHLITSHHQQQQFRSEASTSFMSAGEKPKGWFGVADADGSESSFK